MVRMAIATMLGVLLATAAPALAQEGPQMRPIEATLGAPFLHAGSGLTLPATLVGLPRARVAEIEAPQLDIMATYLAGDDAELSIYVTRSTAGSVPVWFDRATAAITARPMYGTLTPALAASPIASPGARTSGGLIASWSATGEGNLGTGLAILPLGEWLVKLRYSSSTEDGAAVAEKLRSAIAALRWPATMPAATAAQPIAACPRPLRFRGRARNAPQDLASVLIGATLAGTRRNEDEVPAPVTWCRDPAKVVTGGVYRADGSEDSYLLALSDAGRGVEVGPSVGGVLTGGGRKTWSVDFVFPGSTVTFAEQDRLPRPERVMALIVGPPASRVRTVGDRTITLPASAGGGPTGRR